MLMRLSACCFIHNIFKPAINSGLFLAMLFLCGSHGIVSVLEVCLICRPLAAQWDPNVGGACGNQIASFVTIEVLGLALDVAILVLPIRPLFKLTIPLKKKVVPLMIFSSGVM
jgi:hypothetical protein